MTDTKKIEALKQVLGEQIAWYKEYKKKEKDGEVDSSYVYDCLFVQFNDLSRDDFVQVIEILIEDCDHEFIDAGGEDNQSIHCVKCGAK